MEDLPYTAITLDEITRPDGWAPIRRQLGIRSFGVNAWTAAEADEQVIPEHEEGPTGHEEVYVVIAGHASFKVGAEMIDGPTGTVLLVRDPLMIRGAKSVVGATTILTAGGAPGKVYTPHPWETNRDVGALFEAGDFQQAKELLTAALEEYEERTFLLYNLACAEAKLGDHESALGHLSAAISGYPDFAEHAVGDDDLASLRGNPRFQEITAQG
jgi:tetratricopeptide (TPR) repeat protein